MASSRTLLRPGYGTQPVDGRSRRRDDPAPARSRHDAPTSTGSHRQELPAAQITRFRVSSARIGAIPDAGRSEIKA